VATDDREIDEGGTPAAEPKSEAKPDPQGELPFEPPDDHLEDEIDDPVGQVPMLLPAPLTATLPAPLPSAAERPLELRLATVHLRTGLLALARAELETSAGRGELDDPALLDLAEVRWRTDDVTGAGEAAAAYFATGREETLALVIATEATASLGRSTEARRLATRALARGDVPLDSIFLGIRPSSYWPAGGAMAGEPAGTLFGGPPPGSTAGTAGVTGAAVLNRQAPAAVAPPTAEDRRSAPTLWSDAETLPAIAGRSDRSVGRLPEPADELEAARDDLRAGRRSSGAIRLAVVLRLAPALAPAVLDALAGHSGPSAELVRGDALRLVGHERDARQAYATAAAQLDDQLDDEPHAAASDSH
jgi:hypothetical protein